MCERLRVRLGVFWRIGRNRALARLQIAYLLNVLTEFGQWLATLVFAYQRGGATLAGLAALVQLVPAIALGPIITAHGRSRFGVVRMLVTAYAVQTLALALLSLTISTGSATALVFASAVLMSVSLSVSRPMHSVLMPLVVRRPDELTAANVATSWADAIGAIGGPLVAGVMISIGGAGLACGVFAGMSALMPLLAAVHALRTSGESDSDEEGGIRELLAAARAIATDPVLRSLTAYPAGAAAVEGATDLLVVILAVSILSIGPGAAGYLSAAFGVGGLVGAASAILLVGRKLAAPLALAALAGSAALAGLAFVSTVAIAVLLLVIVGASRTVQSVSAQTLMQRSTSLDLMACVFALIEAMRDFGLATGAIAVPVLIHLGGPKAAFIGMAVPAPFIVMLTARRLRSCDKRASIPIVEMGLLRNLEIFAGLPQSSLEMLAREAEHELAPVGQQIIRQGEDGDRYYVIADGGVDVSQNGTVVAHRGRHDGFGEIGLLYDAPRNASVITTEETSLLSIDREAFLTAMNAATAVRAAVTRVAQQRMA